MHSLPDTPRPKFAPTVSPFADEGVVLTPGGQRIELGRRAVLRRIVLALIEQHAVDPAAAISPAALIAAGWPGERMSPASGRNRLHVALATLRTLGLRPWLRRDASGYALCGALVIEERERQVA
jgi:hypothetical protein